MQNKRKLIYSILLVLLFLAVTLGIILALPNRSQGLKVVFLNVGQGDAILISQGRTQILIDGGRDGKLLLEELGHYVPFWDRTIETVIVTHPDQDHLGGLASVLKAYKVETVLETNAQSETQTYKYWEELLQNKKVQKIVAQKGVALKLPQAGELDVLYPLGPVNENAQKDTNGSSVVAKLIYGQNSFLLTGDFPTEKDQELLSSGADLKADVLKVSHHGSKYATSDTFLDAVQPREAIISVGKNNVYGHPNQEVLQRLTAHGSKILRTDEQGDIVYECQNPNLPRRQAGDKCQIVN